MERVWRRRLSVQSAPGGAKIQIKSTHDALTYLEKLLIKADTQLDTTAPRVEIQHQRLAILSSMRYSYTMERRHRETATIQADIASLKSHVDKLSHMHNGRQPRLIS